MTTTVVEVGNVLRIRPNGRVSRYWSADPSISVRGELLLSAVADSESGDVVQFGPGTYRVHGATAAGQQVHIKPGSRFIGPGSDLAIIEGLFSGGSGGSPVVVPTNGSSGGGFSVHSLNDAGTAFGGRLPFGFLPPQPSPGSSRWFDVFPVGNIDSFFFMHTENATVLLDRCRGHSAYDTLNVNGDGGGVMNVTLMNCEFIAERGFNGTTDGIVPNTVAANNTGAIVRVHGGIYRVINDEATQDNMVVEAKAGGKVHVDLGTLLHADENPTSVLADGAGSEVFIGPGVVYDDSIVVETNGGVVHQPGGE